MDKNWLIRTKSNHILGPITKEKVLELYQNGSIKGDDEVCSGNGFWFFIREEEMVEKYLLGNQVQTFNPISEAKDILTSAGEPPEEIETSQDEVTLVGGVDLSMLNTPEESKKAVETEPTPPPPEEEAPPIIEETISPQEEVVSPPKKKTEQLRVVPIQAAKPKSQLKKQNYLKYLGIIGFLILFLLIYFRKTIIRALFEGELLSSISISLVNDVHAQDGVLIKKKAF